MRRKSEPGIFLTTDSDPGERQSSPEDFIVPQKGSPILSEGSSIPPEEPHLPQEYSPTPPVDSLLSRKTVDHSSFNPVHLYDEASSSRTDISTILTLLPNDRIGGNMSMPSSFSKRGGIGAITLSQIQMIFRDFQ